jgi:hypothetical protein
MATQWKAGQMAAAALAVLLWLAVAVGAVAGIYFLRQIFMALFLGFGGELKTAEAIVPWVLILISVLFIVLVIGTTEYHRRHFLQPSSWRLFGWCLAGEVAVAAIYYALIGI